MLINYEFFNGYCPESWLKGRVVRMQLNKENNFESLATGLQVSIVLLGLKAVILKKRGNGNFCKDILYADELINGESLFSQSLDIFPYTSDNSFTSNLTLKEYLATIKKKYVNIQKVGSILCICHFGGYDFCPYCLGSGVTLDHEFDDYHRYVGKLTESPLKPTKMEWLQMQMKYDADRILYVQDRFILIKKREAGLLKKFFNERIHWWQRLIKRTAETDIKNLAEEHLTDLKFYIETRVSVLLRWRNIYGKQKNSKV